MRVAALSFPMTPADPEARSFDPRQKRGRPTHREGGLTMAQDPVCRMDVQPEQAAGQSEYQGRTFYFCCDACKEKFDREPQKYATTQSAMAGKGG
jgi:YHS domain-containing protein